jgi:uncharacterized protein (DUF2249 family)
MESKDHRSLVFWTLDHSSTKVTIELLNDHDPATLRSQFELKSPTCFLGRPWKVAPKSGVLP